MSLDFQFACQLPSGFHARPASVLSGLANGFTSECALTNLRNGFIANLKSALAIIAADVRAGDGCRVQVSGADKEAAHAALRRLIERELGESEEPPAEPVRDGRTGALPRSLKSTGIRCHSGLGVSRGIGQGRVAMVGDLALPIELSVKTAVDPRREWGLVEQAVAALRVRIEAMHAGRLSQTEAAVLRAHLAIVDDVSLAEKLKERIALGRSAGQAVVDAGQFFVGLLRRSESPYVRERGVDVQEICLQLLEQIYGTKFQPPRMDLKEPSVLVADMLPPQQLLRLDRQWLKGLVLAHAGTTSHTVILARSLGIPTLVGVKDAPVALSPGQDVIVDANRGILVSEWTPSVRRFYVRERETLERRRAALARHAAARAVTVDGYALEVGANVSSTEEIVPAFERGADGIGLFRTEMLFVGRDSLPTEEEQFAVYVLATRAAAGRTVIIRTIDVGGDKPLPHLNLPRETNPSLGYRGVRIYPEHQGPMRSQLRAILRASAFGKVRLMVPMVSSMTEVHWVKAQISQAQDELKAQGIAFDEAMSFGIMIEVPSTAFILDQMCTAVDFFSIGTNDLSQYFLAADRDNAKVASLSNVKHPSFLRLLQSIVNEVHKAGKWIGLCGEMAGDVRHIPFLIALGLDEISVAAAEIPALKARIRRLALNDCKRLLSAGVACQHVEEVDRLLDHDQPIETDRPLMDQELVLLGSDSQSKDEAIREIVDAFYVAGRTEDPEHMEEAIWAREAVYSTGMGHGFAIPHCKTDAVTADSVGILKLREPIEWGSLDGKPVSMVILLAIRDSNRNGKHMQVLSKLARRLMNEEFRDELLRGQDAQAVLTHLAEELKIAL